MPPNQTPFHFNQRVTLLGDDDQPTGLIGYVIGLAADRDGQATGDLHVAIAQPGSTGLNGNRNLPAARLRPASGVRA